MTTHRRALRLASGLVAAGLALTAAPHALAADATAGTDGVVKLTDRQAQDLSTRLSADAYPQATATDGADTVGTAPADSTGTGTGGTGTAPGGSGGGSHLDDHAPVTFTAGSTLEGVRGLAATVPAGKDGSYFTVHSLGNVQLHRADGSTSWARTNASLYADWQVKPLRPWDTEPYPARIPLAYDFVSPFNGDAARGYDTADLTGDGVPDLVVSASVGDLPYRPFSSPGSPLSSGSFVTVLDGSTGRTLWSKLYASSTIVRVVDGTLLVSDAPSENSSAPATATATLTGIRFGYADGKLTPAETWTYDTGESGESAWGDLLDLGGGKVAVSFDRRGTTGAAGRGTTFVLDTADGTPGWRADSDQFGRQLRLDASRGRLVAIEQPDYVQQLSYSVVAYDLRTGARTVLDTRLNVAATALTVGDLGGAKGEEYAVAEDSFSPDLYVNASTLRVLGDGGSTVAWTSTTKRTGAGDGPSTWQLDVADGALLASSQDGRHTDDAENVSGLRYGVLTSYKGDNGKVRWQADGTTASPRLHQIDGGVVRTVDQQQNIRTYKLGNGKQQSLTPLQGDLDHAAAADLDGDGRQDVIAGGSSDGVWAFSGPSLLTGTPEQLWRATVPGEVHAVATGDVDGDGRPEVVVAADTATVVLDGRTGKVLTTIDGGGTFVRSVTLADLDGDGKQEVLVPTDALRAYRGNGKPLWTYDAPKGSGEVVFSDAVVSEGQVYVQYSGIGAMNRADSVQNGVALDAAKGGLRWQADPKAPAEAVDGKLHGTLLDHAVFASPKIPYADGHAVVYTWLISAVPGGIDDGGTDLASPMSVTEIRDGRTGEVLHRKVAGGPWSHGDFFTGEDGDGLLEMGFGVLRQYLGGGDDRWTSTTAPLRTAQFITGPDGRKLLVGGVEGGLAAYDPAIVGDGNAFHSSNGSATLRGGRDYLAADLDGDGKEEMVSLNSDALGANRAAELLGGGVLSIDNGIHQMTTYKLS
ncbi:VCBS repeat protein [Kitasatospora sp. SolWspMP-SS2h]|uniref:FG-GAP repeat domain-containing protein n=1 Tax=Kitasatospora sp. SolWspMP-SS2h TaxID=1305729 RepID=UPI000DB9A349|nr:VCBS repeat-containing protein [Kitasatospora sp. SolWspMP-SS2h]RAJ46262.1 VCBS repeat protein [Kitasatospora sp. SolWspMP-SS2h]